MGSTRSSFSLHFGATAWSQIGTITSGAFEILQETLEYFAQKAEERLRQGEQPALDLIPLAAGPVIAECTFDDFQRRVTVNELVAWDGSGLTL